MEDCQYEINDEEILLLIMMATKLMIKHQLLSSQNLAELCISSSRNLHEIHRTKRKNYGDRHNDATMMARLSSEETGNRRKS